MSNHRATVRSGAAYFRRLVLGALCTGAPAMLSLLFFTAFFVTLSRGQWLRVLLCFPPIAAVLLSLWGLWVWRITRPIRLDLAEAEQGPGDVDAEVEVDDARPSQVYRSAQLLPYLLGLSKVALWLVAATVLAGIGVWRWGIDVESAVLMVGETVLVTLGAALYEVLWHRATLAPLLTDLATRWQRKSPLSNPLSLRKKMLIAFGTLTLFACGLSLFWSVMQYKTVATRYIRQLGRLRLRELCAELRERPPAALDEVLRSHARNEVMIYYVPPAAAQALRRGREARVLGYAAGGAAPPLPAWALRTLLAEAPPGPTGQPRPEGDAELPAQRLSLSYAPLGAGLIIVAQPGYRGGDLDTETRILIGFFMFLLLGSMGGVVLIAADLTRPILELARRADAIARGDLERPAVHVAVEADEVGRLYHAFEEMRRALSERFRSSTEVNVALEVQVARRTAELERRNRELKEALEALQRVQQELLHAEKMASMGRLVAGIAHEINNPVNAVVNTAGPLAESLGELSHLLLPGPQGLDDEALAARLRDGAGDMRDMLRVVQRGARRTKEIVQALHNYSRGDGGLPAQVDLHRCLDESLDLLSHSMKSGIKVEKDYGPLAAVDGYAGQLQQVFMNLLINAAQALGERPGPNQLDGDPDDARGPGSRGEPTIRIDTRLAQELAGDRPGDRMDDRPGDRMDDRPGDRIVVSIADNGPGIPADVLPRIFDPFFTTKDVGQGSGLGLSIVHSIIERHGGAIEVQTELGKGTRFQVSLPLRGSFFKNLSSRP